MGGFPDPESGCRRHPNHKQHPGVCSICLTESLSRLTTIDDSDYTTACYSSFSPAIPPIAASEKKTKQRRPFRRRNGSDDHVAVPLGLLLNANGTGKTEGELGLKKSRSVGCAPRIYRGVNVNGSLNGDGGKKRSEKKESLGFWKKLIRNSTSRKMNGGLMHSTTMMNDRSDYTNSSSSSRKLR